MTRTSEDHIADLSAELAKIQHAVRVLAARTIQAMGHPEQMARIASLSVLKLGRALIDVGGDVPWHGIGHGEPSTEIVKAGFPLP